DLAVVGDLEADDVADGDGPEPQHARAVALGEVARDPLEPGDQPGEDLAERQVLPERDGVPLDVVVAGAGLRVPDDAAVLDPLAVGGVGESADQDGDADVLHGPVDGVVRLGVGVGVQVAGVLRPHHQLGPGDLPGADLRGQLPGDPDVVVQDGLALALPVQPDARHVALDDGDGHGPAGRGSA